MRHSAWVSQVEGAPVGHYIVYIMFMAWQHKESGIFFFEI